MFKNFTFSSGNTSQINICVHSKDYAFFLFILNRTSFFYLSELKIVKTFKIPQKKIIIFSISVTLHYQYLIQYKRQDILTFHFDILQKCGNNKTIIGELFNEAFVFCIHSVIQIIQDVLVIFLLKGQRIQENVFFIFYRCYYRIQ